MIKLYRKGSDGRLQYHEAWVAEEGIIEHWGEVGTVGEHKVHPSSDGADEDARVEEILAQARDNGFAEWIEGDLRMLTIEYDADDSDPDDLLAWCQALDQELSDYLGWTGLGHSEGSSASEDGIIFECLVVDVELARTAIAKELDGTVFGSFREITERS